MWTVPRVLVRRTSSPAYADFAGLSSLTSLVVRLDVVPLPPSSPHNWWSGKRSAGGMSGDHDRCFSILVLGCVFITAGPIIKLCAGGEGDSEGHVLGSFLHALDCCSKRPLLEQPAGLEAQSPGSGNAHVHKSDGVLQQRYFLAREHLRSPDAVRALRLHSGRSWSEISWSEISWRGFCL